MAALRRLSVDEEFRQDNYNQNSWGVKNAGLEKMTSGVKRGQAANTPNKPTRRYNNDAVNQYKYIGPQEAANDNEALETPQNARVAERYYQEEMPAVSSSTSRKTTVKVRTSLFARGRGIAFGVATISWMSILFIFWQLPIAAVGAIMLGLATQIQSSYLLSAVDTAASTVGSLFGYEYSDLNGLAMLCVITAAGFGVVSAGIAGFTAILWGLHPLSGNAAGTKMATFLVGIVGACVPFANMFPWIIFWILVMMRHPK
jgi:hypothetical protein